MTDATKLTHAEMSNKHLPCTVSLIDSAWWLPLVDTLPAANGQLSVLICACSDSVNKLMWHTNGMWCMKRSVHQGWPYSLHATTIQADDGLSPAHVAPYVCL